MNYSSYDIKFEQGSSKMHRFNNTENGIPIFLLHGFFEDGRIFYSKKGKGLAPYLANNGYDVFVCDLLGKGGSVPSTHDGFKHSQFDIITRDIPVYLEFVRTKTKQQKIHLGAHSWGGVVLLSYLARFKDPDILSVFTFGSKRRIGMKNLRKVFMIDIMWNLYGTYLANKHGFLPAASMKMGTENEPKDYFLETNIWVNSIPWVSPVDQFDYHAAFLKYNLPPTLYITGSHDKILGNPKDVLRLREETGNHQQATFRVIGKKSGFKNDYDHINLLTHKDAPIDHFPLVLNFIKQFE